MRASGMSVPAECEESARWVLERLLRDRWGECFKEPCERVLRWRRVSVSKQPYERVLRGCRGECGKTFLYINATRAYGVRI
jgi:hypothetical protein